MRSSKSRSRSKSNRPRSIGNIINRVFDSSGPEGKVRGTPQQIIEKYQILARDAQLSNDRVAAENFMQHAEHYTRMLAEAQRELAAEQEQRQQGSGQGYGGHQPSGQQGGGQQGYGQNGGQAQNRDRMYRDDRVEPRGEPRVDPRIDMSDDQPDAIVPVRSAGMMDFIDTLGDSGLVETPEARRNEAAPPRTEFRDRPAKTDQPRRDRRDDRKPRGEEMRSRTDAPAVQPGLAQPAVAATEADPTSPKRARAPRKPKAEPGDDGGTGGPAEAAE